MVYAFYNIFSLDYFNLLIYNKFIIILISFTLFQFVILNLLSQYQYFFMFMCIDVILVTYLNY